MFSYLTLLMMLLTFIANMSPWSISILRWEGEVIVLFFLVVFFVLKYFRFVLSFEFLLLPSRILLGDLHLHHVVGELAFYLSVVLSVGASFNASWIRFSIF